MTAYTATTTNATNTITATPDPADAVVSITLNGAAHVNGTAASWEAGENVVAITVSNGSASKQYVVTVAKN